MYRHGQPPTPSLPTHQGHGLDPAPGYHPVPAPPTRRRGRVGKVLLGIVGVGFLLLVVLVAIGAAFGNRPAPTRNAVDGSTEKAGRLSAIDLRPGDCYNVGQLPPEPGSTQLIRNVDVVPCTTPHTDQVIDKITYQAGDSLAAVRADRAWADCEKAYQAKLSPSAAKDPSVQRGLIAPRDDATWARHPVVACTVTHPGRSTSVVA